MEKIIKLDSFNRTELNELKTLLENNQITGMDIKAENEFVIKYHEKKVKLSPKFILKIEQIRNKYYRELLNMINALAPKEIYSKAFDEWGKCIYIKDFINVKKYSDMLKMELINYIGTYGFDNIFELSKEEMLELIDFKYGKNNISNICDYKYELLGMYCHSSEKLFSVLESKVNKTKLNKMKKCCRFILICPQLIKEFCNEYYFLFKEFNLQNKEHFYKIMYDKVLLHEIGHGVFDYLSDLNDEKRANYFASLSFDGAFDNIIKAHTVLQSEAYKDPKLIKDTDDIVEIAESIYNL